MGEPVATPILRLSSEQLASIIVYLREAARTARPVVPDARHATDDDFKRVLHELRNPREWIPAAFLPKDAREE